MDAEYEENEDIHLGTQTQPTNAPTRVSEATSKTKNTAQSVATSAGRSKVWQFFDKVVVGDKIRANCNKCQKSYAWSSRGSGTSTLWGHIPTCPKRTSENKQSKLILQPIDEGGSSGSLTNWKFDQQFVRAKLTKMVVVAEMPFRFVENDVFKEFMAAAQPCFKIPSRWTLSRDCYQLFLDEKLKLRDFFKKTGQRICLTTDTWTSVQKINYMCITAHYVDEDWKLIKKIINFCPIESHKGDELGKQIDDCLLEWGVSKIFTITVDNASSNDTCLNYLKGKLSSRNCVFLNGKYLQMRCIAHIINLTVVDGIKEVKRSIKKIRDAVRYVRLSPARIARFKECCEYEGIEYTKMLCLDVSTRWNSTYLMLDVAQKYELGFQRFGKKDTSFPVELKHGPPSFVDWQNARRLVDILSNFYELTLRVSGTSYVTSNEFYHEISSVHCLLKDWLSNDDANVRAMGKAMKDKYDKYWGESEKMNDLIYVAVIVDPRYKMEFLEYALCEEYGQIKGLEMVKGIKDSVNELFEAYKLIYQPRLSSPTHNANEVSNASESAHQGQMRKKSRFLLGDKFKKYKIDSGEVESKCDLDVYLKESVLVVEKDDFDILTWWKLNRNRFPVLSYLARDVLAIPVSTVASESAFSTGGRVVDDYRSSLTPTIVEALICTQDWLKKGKMKTLEESLEEVQKMDEDCQNVGTSVVSENTTD